MDRLRDLLVVACPVEGAHPHAAEALRAGFESLRSELSRLHQAVVPSSLAVCVLSSCRGLRIPNPATIPPAIISTPPTVIPRWKPSVAAETDAASTCSASSSASPFVSGLRSGSVFASSTTACASGEIDAPASSSSIVGAELARDQRAEDRDREQAGDPRDAVVDPRRDAGVAVLDRVERGRGQRRDGRREAEAEEEQAGQDVRDVVGVGADPGQQQQPDPADDRPDRHRQPRPGARSRSCRSAARGRTGAARPASSRSRPGAAM